MKCSVADCNAPIKYKGMCGKHYKRMWRHGDPKVAFIVKAYGDTKCEVEGCDRVAQAIGYCSKHYQRLMRTGRLHLIRAENGTAGKPTNDYIQMYVGRRHVYEHIHVAEKALGKRLPKGAEVHHINGNKKDNRPENLVVCPNKAYHMLIHQLMRDLGISFS